MTSRPMDPDAARRAVKQAEARTATLADTAHRERGRHAVFAAGVGIAMGGYVFTTLYLQSRSLAWWFVSLIVYLLAILGLSQYFNLARRATSTRWQRTYRPALAVSMAGYIGGIVVNTIWFSQDLWLAVVFGVVVAAPMLVASWRTAHERR